jgi:ATP-binding cassette subfamily F protein 3
VLDRTKIHLDLGVDETKADIALSVRGYSRGFGERLLFRDAHLNISCGERVALVGPNGSGKTTFLRDLVDRGSWEDPVLRVGPSLSLGYCAQNQETLDPNGTIREVLMASGVRTNHEALSVASSVLFGFQELDRRVADLSGGERNRLQLACLGVRGATFLILDEPTNHMDVAAREVIEETLAAFKGTVLVVSHDRYFLDKITTAVVEIRDQGFHRYPGDPLEFWQVWSASRASVRGRVGTRGREHAKARETAGAPAGPAHTERRLQDLEREKANLERKLAQAFESGEHQRGGELSRRLERVLKLMDELYERWEQETG